MIICLEREARGSMWWGLDLDAPPAVTGWDHLTGQARRIPARGGDFALSHRALVVV